MPSMPSGCEKVKFRELRKQLSLGSLTRKISRSSQGSSVADGEEGCIREVSRRLGDEEALNIPTFRRREF